MMAENFLRRIQMGQIIKEKEANFLLLFSTFLSTKICGQERGVISRAGTRARPNFSKICSGRVKKKKGEKDMFNIALTIFLFFVLPLIIVVTALWFILRPVRRLEKQVMSSKE